VIVYDENLINVACDDSSWVVDSGASFHVTSRKDFFSSYTPGDFGVLKMGNNDTSKVVGIGTVCLKTNNETKLILKNVRHAPDIQLHLISASILNDDGYFNTFGGAQWKPIKGSLVVVHGMKFSGLYWLKASILFNVVNVVDCDNSSDLWHKRLSHISEKGMNCLVEKNLLPGLKGAKLENCVHCLDGKQHRVSFKSHPPSKKSEVLELVHSDLCGPMRTKTFGGGLYFVTFIDDHSRKLWVYVLKTKDRVLSVFKQFQASVERESGKKLKCVPTDNGMNIVGSRVFDIRKLLPRLLSSMVWQKG